MYPKGPANQTKTSSSDDEADIEQSAQQQAQLAEQRTLKIDENIEKASQVLGSTVSAAVSARTWRKWLMTTSVMVWLLSLGLSITCFVLFLVRYNSNLAIDTQNAPITWLTLTENSVDVRIVFTSNPTLVSAIVLLFPFLFYFFAMLIETRKEGDIKTKAKQLKWVNDSLFTPAVIVVTCMAWGIAEGSFIFQTFACAHLTVLLLAYSEMVDEMKSKSKEGISAGFAAFLALWAGLLTYMPLLVLLIGSAGSLNGATPPIIAVIAFVIVITSFFLQIVLNLAYRMRKASDKKISTTDIWNMWITNESWNALLVILPRVVALFMLALVFTNDNGWLQRHGHTTTCMVDLLPISSGSKDLRELVPQSCCASDLNVFPKYVCCLLWSKEQSIPDCVHEIHMFGNSSSQLSWYNDAQPLFEALNS